MLTYTPRLITRDYLRLHRRLQEVEVKDDPLIDALIDEASAEFQEAVGRVFMPYVATNKFGASHLDSSLCLDLRDDLLAVTSITNGNSAAISAGYDLRPDNTYPKRRVELASAGGQTWQLLYVESRIQIAGIWGYAPHYPRVWKRLTTLSADAAIDADSLSLTSIDRVQVGDWIKIVDEIMFVTGRPDTVLVEREQLGTTAAAHANDAPVYVFRQLSDVKGAVRDLAAYKYLHKDQIGSRVKVYEGGMVTVEDLDPSVQKTISRHRRQAMPRAV